MKFVKQRSFLSERFLLWCAPLVYRGLRSPLQEQDVPGLPELLHTQSFPVGQAENLLNDGHSLFYVARTFLPGVFPTGVFYGVMQGVMSNVVRTLLLRWLVQSVGSDIEDQPSPAMRALAVISLGLVLALEGIASTASRHLLCDQLGHGFFGMASVLIHRKSLRVSVACKSPLSATSLVGNDLVRMLESVKMLSFTPMGISQVVCGSVMVLWLNRLGAVVGLCFVTVLVVCNVRLGRLIKKVEQSSLAVVDKRLELMRQMIIGIKAIKLSAWEEPFMEKLKQARNDECVFLRRYRLMFQASTQIGRVCPILGAALCFIVQGTTSSHWHAADVFAALTVWHGMRMGFIQIPTTIALLSTASVAAKRVLTFLLLPEMGSSPFQQTVQQPGAPTRQDECSDVETRFTVLPEEHGIKEEQMSMTKFSWGKVCFSFQPSTLSFMPGVLTGVAGAVGAGKSSLLLAVLGELQPSAGHRQMPYPMVSYVPQSPVIICGTIMENVLMGRLMCGSDLQRALDAAALSHDVAKMPSGLQTQIGERGVMLSGGQQMRVSIARALYGNAKLLLADDPLAAVDSEVALQIFSKGFLPYVHGADKRAVALVLNQPHFLERCDRVLVVQNHAAYELSQTQVNRQLLASITQDATPASSAEEEASPVLPPDPLLVGAMSSDVLMTYVHSMGLGILVAAILICLGTYGAMAGADRLLAQWLGQESESDSDMFVALYGILCVVFMLGAVSCSLLLAIAGVRAGRTLHNTCLTHVMHAPLSWFEHTPSGRIISRFSSDLLNVDLYVPYYFDNTCQFLTTLLALSVTVCYLVPALIAVMLVSLLFYGILVVAVDRTNRECKRLTNLAMAPVLTALQEASSGCVLMRCMGLQQFAIERFDSAVDEYKCLSFASSSVINFGMLCSYIITVLISSCTAAAIVADAGNYRQEQAALALSYSVTIPYFLLFLSFNIYNLQTYLAALERLLQYKGSSFLQEPEWHCAHDVALPKSWPAEGSLEFEAVELRYRNDMPPAIQSFSMVVSPGEKLGVVGRSGAGKSSLVQLIFRLRECTAGRILLDGQDISKVGLQTLRCQLAVIPQEALLIAGTLRANLDPFGNAAESDLHDIVKSVGLASRGTHLEILERDSESLSCGEQQLLTFARVLMRQTVLIVMDEPTSKVDQETDTLVQTLVRERLSRATVLTIAHRLHTVMDFDRILVLQDGKLQECASPCQLLSDSNSKLRNFVQALGTTASAELHKIAGANLETCTVASI